MLEKKIFGDDHEIQYDTIINHDTYSFLRVSLEVARGQDTEAVVVLNGKEVGLLRVNKQGKKTIGYHAFRKTATGTLTEIGLGYRKMGKAITAIILHDAFAT